MAEDRGLRVAGCFWPPSAPDRAVSPLSLPLQLLTLVNSCCVHLCKGPTQAPSSLGTQSCPGSAEDPIFVCCVPSSC